MKVKNKIITLALAVTLILGMTLLTCGAESYEKIDTGAYLTDESDSERPTSVESSDDSTDEMQKPEATNGEENKANEVLSEDDGDSITAGTPESDPALDANSGNIFEVIYETFEEYSAEIMSLLAFVGSLILAICYKSGLTPLVQNALGGMLNAVGKLKENVDASEENSGRITTALTERLESAEKIITELNEAVSKMSTTLESERTANEWREQMKTVLTGQIDMLYDIFMTSALPQYQKDAVGERVQAMRAAIAGGDGGNDA